MSTKFITPEICPRIVSYKELLQYLNGCTAYTIGTIPVVWQYLSKSQRRQFMKQIIWTAVFQIIDLLQVLFKDYVIERSNQKDVDIIAHDRKIKDSNIT